MQVLITENKLSSYKGDSVAVTFATAFQSLHTSSRDTANLLLLLSFFDIEGISTDIVVEGTRPLISTPEPISTPRPELDRSGDSTGHTSNRQRGMIQDLFANVVDLQNLSRLIQSGEDLQMAIEKLQALSFISIGGDSGRPLLWINVITQYLVQYKVMIEDDRKF